MWMKNTYIPLDMVFIDDRGRIQSIVEKTTPHSLATIRSDNPPSPSWRSAVVKRSVSDSSPASPSAIPPCPSY